MKHVAVGLDWIYSSTGKKNEKMVQEKVNREVEQMKQLCHDSEAATNKHTDKQANTQTDRQISHTS